MNVSYSLQEILKINFTGLTALTESMQQNKGVILTLALR